MKTVELAIVMPIYNEAANIGAVMEEWIQELQRLGVSFAVLAINDGSTDNTREILQKVASRHPGLVLQIEKQNAGHGQACRTGYSFSIERNSTWTFQIDSDGQCDPQFFSAFWRAREEADCIFGLRKTRDDGMARTFISIACRFFTLLVSGMDLKDLNVPYRLIRTSALKSALLKIPTDFDMQNIALTLAMKRDPHLTWKYIPIHFRDRRGGATSINFGRLISMGCELLINLHKIRR